MRVKDTFDPSVLFPRGIAQLVLEPLASQKSDNVLAVEHGEHIYRPDLYLLEFTVVNK